MGAGIYLTFMVDVIGEMVSLSINQDQGRVRHVSAVWVPIPWDHCWQQTVSLDLPQYGVPAFYVVMMGRGVFLFFQQ